MVSDCQACYGDSPISISTEGDAKIKLLVRITHAVAFVFCIASLQATAQEAPAFSKEQLDQLTAPIALYPDTLLSQILMASTYPADVADAAKWSKQNSSQKGEEAVKAVESQPWDPAVKSLVAFPQVLAMMGDKPDWVQNLGDAFLASSKDVLDSVQRLRAKAQAAGNLKSSEQQKVKVEKEPERVPQEVIIIESADPQIVYVPTYNPTVVYGTWPYPAYPPYYYPPPPMYYPGYAFASGLAFGIGVGITASLWGNCNWGHGDVDIDVNRYNNINVNNKIDGSHKNFQHNPENRRGAPYRDQRSQQKYGKDVPGASDRSNYRGRDPARDSQRQQAQSTLQQRGMDPNSGREQLRNNPQERERAQNASQGTNRDRTGGPDASRADNQLNSDRAGSANRDYARETERARGGNDNAFRDAGNAQQSRQQIDRGNASRQQMSQRSGGGARAGGGGGRRR